MTTGAIVSLPPLIEQPPGNNSSNPAGLPGVTNTAAVPTLPQTWTGVQTFEPGTIVLDGSGGPSEVLRQSTANGAVTVGQLSFADISGSIGPVQIPPPTPTTLGGVFSKAAASHQFVTQIGTDGTVSQAQPAFTDISGSVVAGQMPALTGDITTTAGAVATTLATVNSNVGTFGSATLAPQITTNGKGLITAVATVTITPAIGSVTGLGTGVATALGVAVGSAGAPVVNGGALGTPSSGVGTNLTGTAAGLTAGHVTTNANLTGDVTSVGNATTLATGNAGNLNSGTLLAARMPALTGDVTTSAGAVATTIAANAVTNAKAAQMGAATFKGNPTNATANASDFTIQGLTARGAPDAANDKIPLYDNAAGTIKYVTPAQIAGASSGTVTSVATAGLASGGPITTSGTITVTAAAKTDQQTPTSNALAVTPLHQQDHPSAAKAWAYVTYSGATPTLVAGFNIASIAAGTTGNLVVNFTVPFANTSYVAHANGSPSASNTCSSYVSTKNTGSLNWRFAENGTLTNPASGDLVCFGTQ